MSNHKNINTNANKKKQMSQMSIMTFLSQKTKKDNNNTADEDTDKDLLTDNNTNNNNNQNDNSNIKDNDTITNPINNNNSVNNIINPTSESSEPSNTVSNTNDNDNNNNTSNNNENNNNKEDIPMTNISETKPTQQEQPLPPTITEPIIAYGTKILGKKRKDNKTYYKIEWADNTEPSWVTSDLIEDKTIIDIYNLTYTKSTTNNDLYMGSLQNNDIPNEILYHMPSFQSYSNDIAVLVSWKKRKNGTIPNNSICYLSELKRNYIQLVIKYLEKHLLFLSP